MYVSYLSTDERLYIVNTKKVRILYEYSKLKWSNNKKIYRKTGKMFDIYTHKSKIEKLFSLQFF